MEVNCLFCGSNIHLVFVHGHYQCLVCKTNACPTELVEGCDGDNCNNAFLSDNFTNNIPENNRENFLEQ